MELSALPFLKQGLAADAQADVGIPVALEGIVCSRYGRPLSDSLVVGGIAYADERSYVVLAFVGTCQCAVAVVAE